MNEETYPVSLFRLGALPSKNIFQQHEIRYIRNNRKYIQLV